MFCRSKRKSVLKDWCWSWNSNPLATWCEELTCWKRPCCWERWRAGGEGDDRGWDGRMAWLTWLMWVWTSSGNWWWTGRPGLLQSMGSQRVRHNWATELNPWSGEVTDQENHERNIHNAWRDPFSLSFLHLQAFPHLNWEGGSGKIETVKVDTLDTLDFLFCYILFYIIFQSN